MGGNLLGYIDALGLCWIYHQSTHLMEHMETDGNIDCSTNGAYSGNGTGLNDHYSQGVQAQYHGDNAGLLNSVAFTQNRLQARKAANYYPKPISCCARIYVNTGNLILNCEPRPSTLLALTSPECNVTTIFTRCPPQRRPLILAY